MDGLFWVLVVGVAGWMTGKMIGETGYGEALGGYTDGLDIILGVLGGFVGGYLFFWVLSGEVSSFVRYTIAIICSITLVGVVRLVFARYLPSSAR